MIKNLLFTLIICCGFGLLHAQSYQDDFESYDVGNYVGNVSPSFTTWSGTTGGAEDALIVDDKAKSGTKSIYFYGTGQGPQDVLIDFGGKHETGTFTLSFSVYITEGAEAYWNFQQEVAPGVTWAGNAYYRDNDMMVIDAADQALATPFNAGEWNDLSYFIDLDNNEWIIQLNGECVGTLVAPASVASLDIFPLTTTAGLSEFWIDDVSFEYSDTPVAKSTDLVLTNVAVSGAAFANEGASIEATVVNAGTGMIIAYEIAYASGSESGSQSFDQPLAPGESAMLFFEDAFVAQKDLNVIEVSVTSINDLSADDAPCNNRSVSAATGIDPTPDKAVVVEEATGTWCTWCPRGAVFMERMEDRYEDRFVGIAVHNNDPMMVTEYDAFITGITGGGWPNATVERSGSLDPSGIEVPIINALQDPINETISISATYDEELNEVVAIVRVNAINEIKAARDIIFVITEDDVTGTTADYAQVNAYAGGGNGPMGGYEDLPNPVPASLMVYDQVARAILPAPGGMDIGEDIEAGGYKDFTFGLALDPEFDVEHLNLIAMVSGPPPQNGIDNAYKISLSDALLVVNNEDTEIDLSFDVFPNPVTDFTNIRVNIEQSSDVYMEIYSVTGQLVTSKDYGKVQGDNVFTLNTTDFNNGVYNVVLSVNGQRTIKKVVVSH